MSLRLKFSRLLALTSFSLVVAAAVLAPSRMAGAQTILHAFGSGQFANYPGASLIQATDGNFYGTTDSGGPSGLGTVFSMTPAGSVTVLHAFAGGATDGASPRAALIQAADGNFYGTTVGGGAFDDGTVFRMTPAGAVTILHAFAGWLGDGAYPSAALIQATDGNFYGTTFSGGAFSLGTVFTMTPDGSVTILHSFSSASDGSSPYAALLQATDGNFYGTTSSGTVFMMAPAGLVTVLHTFQAAPGGDAILYAALIQATDGNFYSIGPSGPFGFTGTIFRMTPAGVVTDLHLFTGGAMDGAHPRAALLQSTDGNFYGTTFSGGASGLGTAFTMTPDGSVTVLHSFNSATDGSHPEAALVRATDGNFYGTTPSLGALGGDGRVFTMTTGGTVTILHTFVGVTADGGFPEAALVQASDGNFYGTTSLGGAFFSGGDFTSGTVFAMTADGAYTVLHSFSGASDGSNPQAALIQATDGKLYGTTSSGGASDLGTVFTVTPAGVFNVLHVFAGGATDGAAPGAALIQAADGNFYGTTYYGGASNYGTVFRMTPAGTITVLHAFAGAPTDGAFPLAALCQAADGNFYGTTYDGGASNYGTVFRMTPAGIVTVLHSFAATDGANPQAALLQAADGNFYGTTYLGGAYGQNGTVFKMTVAGAFTVLHSFRSAEGSAPQAALIQATDGNFYGTTYYGGFNVGTVFKMTPAGAVTMLHLFSYPTDGYGPKAALIQAADGDFYGTTLGGGAFGAGVVFKLPAPKRNPDDLDADGRADPTVYRPSSGVWYVLQSGTNYTTSATYQWGVSSDIPVPADYDGDGKTDIAAYRPTAGLWYILLSSTNFATYVGYQWGITNDVPVPADYDGDGKADIAIYRPATGSWYILLSSTNFATYISYQWGVSTDVPVPADYDGDGKADIAVYRPAAGIWYILLSSTNFATYVSYQWGASTDIPLPADYDGDHKADIAVYRPATGVWYIVLSSTNDTTRASYQWGGSTDVPVPADYDGDGKTDMAVYRPDNGRWYILLSSTNFTTSVSYQWGVSTDVPVLKRP
ncbi:MAG TPA: choice-of-anchor tandem repeat GloVer-containing protein [Vicinamibacterales bacterium]|nr:choice-of-anchor tandem repeat GloVer-containing protein [Vicinamibacterales bacterium]